MKKKYNSKFFNFPIEVESVNGDKLLFITTNSGKKVIYSGYDLDKKQTQIPYINKCLLGGFIKKIPKKVLILGLGGGSFAKYLEDHIDKVEITGIDIDEEMIEISKKEMLLESNNLFCLDAKIAVSKLYRENKVFDFILIDCYGIDSEVPEELTTKIFFENCKKILEEDGTISINMANFLLDNNIENLKRVTKYREMHSNLKQVFGKYFSLITHGDGVGENVVGIYNLNKFYSAKEFNDNYIEKAENGEIKYDYNLILNTYVDESKTFLN